MFVLIIYPFPCQLVLLVLVSYLVTLLMLRYFLSVLVVYLAIPTNVHGAPRKIMHLFATLMKKLGACVSVNQNFLVNLVLLHKVHEFELVNRSREPPFLQTIILLSRTSISWKKPDGEETVFVKHDFKHYDNTFGVKIKTYHTYNGRFADTSFKEDYLCQ